jgi:alginate O-acetyltransferase complex protein AlgI
VLPCSVICSIARWRKATTLAPDDRHGVVYVREICTFHRPTEAHASATTTHRRTMSFVSIEYAIFFAAIFFAYWSLRGRHLSRTLLIVLASAWFYTRFDYGRLHPHLGWIYLGVLFSSATIDFHLARAILAVDQSELASRDPQAAATKRKRLLIVSIVYNLGVLAYFKYTGFAVDNVLALLQSVGIHVVRKAHLAMVLPIGISFFTFETMSYTVDVYRRDLKPSESFLEYLLFISFFPHLVAGPIIRPRDMLPQLRRAPTLEPTQAAEGMFLVAVGLLKKVVIADYLAVNHVDRVFDRPEWFSAPEALAAVYGYALQIYCDFSGYTDIAIGSALLLGIVLPKNFDAPYQSRDLQEFWHRWHISLSSWLRDYLYIPLGGSRGSAFATYRNLMITMLLGGLWHGASWNFVIWGALHGAALAGTRMWQRARSAAGKMPNTAPWAVALSVFLTFHYVCLAWVFFRADGFSRAFAMLRQIATGPMRFQNLTRPVLLVLALGFVVHFIPANLFRRIRAAFVSMPAPAQGIALFVVALVLKRVASSQVVPFVYFQF